MKNTLRAGCLIVPAIACLLFLIESGLGGEYFQRAKDVLIQSVIPKGNGQLEKASIGILVNSQILYCSGMIGTFPKNGSLPEGFEIQADNAIQNIWYCLQNDVSNKTNPCGYDNIVLVTAYMTDLNNKPKYLDLVSNYYTKPYPTTTIAQVEKLPRDALIEIGAVAYCGEVIREPEYASASQEY